jgi:putative transcriptional regulator
LIFGADVEAKYEKAMRKLGVDLGKLSSEAGHA